MTLPPLVSRTAKTKSLLSDLLTERNEIVAFVSVVFAVRRPANLSFKNNVVRDLSKKATLSPKNDNWTRRNVLLTLKVHSSFKACPSKTKTGLQGCDIMVNSCDSAQEKKTTHWFCNISVSTTESKKLKYQRRQSFNWNGTSREL